MTAREATLPDSSSLELHPSGKDQVFCVFLKKKTIPQNRNPQKTHKKTQKKHNNKKERNNLNQKKRNWRENGPKEIVSKVTKVLLGTTKYFFLGQNTQN